MPPRGPYVPRKVQKPLMSPRASHVHRRPPCSQEVLGTPQLLRMAQEPPHSLPEALVVYPAICTSCGLSAPRAQTSPGASGPGGCFGWCLPLLPPNPPPCPLPRPVLEGGAVPLPIATPGASWQPQPGQHSPPSWPGDPCEQQEMHVYN